MVLLKSASNIGTDFFCLNRKFLVYNLLSRNLKIKYRRSALGVLWTLFTPLLLTGIYYFVFKVVMRVQVPRHLTYILSGVLPWAFFSQSISESTEILVANTGLLSRVPVPVHLLPYVSALTHFTTLLIAMPIVVGSALLENATPTVWWPFLGVYGLLLFLMTYSLSLIVGIGFVYFRDLRHLVGLGLQLLFYATPVLYSAEMIPEKYRWFLYFNPLAHLFDGIHRILVEGLSPDLFSLAISCAWVGVLLAITFVFLRKFGPELVENL